MPLAGLLEPGVIPEELLGARARTEIQDMIVALKVGWKDRKQWRR